MTCFARTLLVAVLGWSATNLAAQLPPFHGGTDLVVTHVTVTDRRGRFVPNLEASAFTLLEDGRPQTIRVFTHDDLPATIGLVVDSSASVWPIRRRLIDAATSFALAAKADDELFALTFNDAVTTVLPEHQPFTSDGRALGALLDRAVLATGRTALFDAIIRGLDLLETGHRSRRVLVIIGDGGDNASQSTRNDVLRRVQASNVQIYAVALRDPDNRDARPQVLRAFTDAAGGRTLPSHSDLALAGALRDIADDLRHSYTIGYEPDRPPDDGVRQIRVKVAPPRGERVTVRARNAYIAARDADEGR